MNGVVAAAAPSLSNELGLCAFLFDARARPVKVSSFVNHGSPMEADEVEAWSAKITAQFGEHVWTLGPACATASEFPEYRKSDGLAETDRRLGIRDWLIICAHDDDGLGCFLGAPLRKLHAVPPRERALWHRVACHVTTGLRLRRRFSALRSVHARKAVSTGPDALTMREKEVLTLAVLGRDNKVIAYELGLSASTVRVHMAHATRKLETKSRAAAIGAYSEILRRQGLRSLVG